MSEFTAALLQRIGMILIVIRIPGLLIKIVIPLMWLFLGAGFILLIIPYLLEKCPRCRTKWDIKTIDKKTLRNWTEKRKKDNEYI